VPLESGTHQGINRHTLQSTKMSQPEEGGAIRHTHMHICIATPPPPISSNAPGWVHQQQAQPGPRHVGWRPWDLRPPSHPRERTQASPPLASSSRVGSGSVGSSETREPRAGGTRDMVRCGMCAAATVQSRNHCQSATTDSPGALSCHHTAWPASDLPPCHCMHRPTMISEACTQMQMQRHVRE
jgi:hypothetical protein